MRLDAMSKLLSQAVKKDLGFFIAGEPGSGKTSIALAIANEIKNNSKKQIELIALDLHGFKNHWQENNIPFVYTPKSIVEQINLIHEEYTNRKENNLDRNQLVIIFDEYMETLAEIEQYYSKVFKKKSEVNELKNQLILTIRSLITGGRKYGINLILINHSFNSTSIGIDNQTKQGFIGIVLNSVADEFYSRKEKSEVQDWLKKRKNKYRAVLTGAFSDSPMIHPTHHNYHFIENNQPPLVSFNLDNIYPTIKLVKEGIFNPCET